VTATPFRAAIGRARLEAFAATGPTPEPEAPAGERTEFEYRLVKRRGKRFAEEEAWNALGLLGWELVGVTDRPATFKRPRWATFGSQRRSDYEATRSGAP
jgi:hypothetical protein